MKLISKASIAALVLALGLVSVPRNGFAQSFQALLRGTSEVPPNASTATGFSTLLLVGNMLTVNVQFSGLMGGNATAAHIHCCSAVGVNSSVNIGFAGFPGATSGVYNAMFDLTGNAALVGGLNSGLAYVNIHNATFPGGEIRGQISVVPEPSTVLLVACGMIALGVAAGRRKAA